MVLDKDSHVDERHKFIIYSKSFLYLRILSSLGPVPALHNLKASPKRILQLCSSSQQWNSCSDKAQMLQNVFLVDDKMHTQTTFPNSRTVLMYVGHMDP